MSEDIIYMVQETIFAHPNDNPFDFQIKTIEQLQYFASLVADAEQPAQEPVAEADTGGGMKIDASAPLVMTPHPAFQQHVSKPMTKQEWLSYIERTWDTAQREAWGEPPRKGAGMTREDIIAMAQECQLIGMRPYLDGIYQESLERFASLVADAEREACAKACEEVAEAVTYQRNSQAAADKCAEAIRARGQT